MSNQKAPKNIRGSHQSKIYMVGLLICILTLFGGCKPKESIRTYDTSEVLSEESATIPIETTEEAAEETEEIEEVKEETKLEEVISSNFVDPYVAEPTIEPISPIPTMYTVPKPTNLIPVPIKDLTFFTKPNDGKSYAEETDKRIVKLYVFNFRNVPCLFTFKNVDTQELITFFRGAQYNEEVDSMYDWAPDWPIYPGEYGFPLFIEPGIYDIYMEIGIVWYGIKDGFGEDGYTTVLKNYDLSLLSDIYGLLDDQTQMFNNLYSPFGEAWDDLRNEQGRHYSLVKEINREELPYIDLIK